MRGRSAHHRRPLLLARRLVAFLLLVALAARLAEVFAALRDVALDLPRAAAFAALRGFFDAARLAVAFLADDFLADDFLAEVFAAFRTVRFGRGGSAAIGGTNSGSETRPAAVNGMAAASLCSTFGGSSAFSASEALFAISFTVSVNFSRIDLSLSMMPSSRLREVTGRRRAGSNGTGSSSNHLRPTLS